MQSIDFEHKKRICLALICFLVQDYVKRKAISTFFFNYYAPFKVEKIITIFL